MTENEFYTNLHTANELYHHGVKGQKWGVRRYVDENGHLTERGKKKYSNITTLKNKKNNDYIQVAEHRNKHPKLVNDKNFTVLKNGKRIGDMFIESHGNDLYLNWISIKKTERGKGYANSVMDYVVDYSKKHNYKTLSLEVPGSSPDAKHIYEKHGFKEIGSMSDADDVWGGLTKMKRIN